VDARLIERTQQWLAGQQQADGSWKPDASFINEGATNRYNTDVLRITAYLAWSLEDTGYQGPAVERAKHFIDGHMSAKADAYTLAVLANFAADYGKDRDFASRCADGEGRPSVVERGRNRRICHRNQRRGGNDGTGRAGAAEMGQRFGHRP
jgi:hypothetical protein